MRKQAYFLLLLIGVLFSTLFTACQGEDRRTEYQSQTAINEWIYGQLKEVYLWNDLIPDRTNLNFYTQPKTFFESLLSKNEYKSSRYYSYMEEVTATKAIKEESSYGFEFMLYQISGEQNAARVLYVLPNSPASEAKLKRGDWILNFNKTNITSTNYTQLMSGSGLTLTMGTMSQDGKNVLTPSAGAPIIVAASRKVDNDPIIASNVFTSKTGSKIGYMAYTYFPNNLATTSAAFNAKLFELITTFRASNVSEFILDLRYNPGGYVTDSQLLGTLLAPDKAIDQIFCTIKYNKTRATKEEIVKFDHSLIKSSGNLNLDRLFVLVSKNTASASELVINGLKPYIPVTLIGTTTEGKNLCSQICTNKLYNWELHPITGQLYNSKGESDYSAGFVPDFVLDESGNMAPLKEFGDKDELMTQKAIAIINGDVTIPPKSATTKGAINNHKIIKSSLDRRKMNGALLAPTH